MALSTLAFDVESKLASVREELVVAIDTVGKLLVEVKKCRNQIDRNPQRASA